MFVFVKNAVRKMMIEGEYRKEAIINTDKLHENGFLNTTDAKNNLRLATKTAYLSAITIYSHTISNSQFFRSKERNFLISWLQ